MKPDYWNVLSTSYKQQTPLGQGEVKKKKTTAKKPTTKHSQKNTQKGKSNPNSKLKLIKTEVGGGGCGISGGFVWSSVCVLLDLSLLWMREKKYIYREENVFFNIYITYILGRKNPVRAPCLYRGGRTALRCWSSPIPPKPPVKDYRL